MNKKKMSQSIRRKYVTAEMLEKAKRMVASGNEYECRISSLQFIRFTGHCLTLYWANATSDWKKKQVYTWMDLEAYSINQMLNNVIEWEDWL